MSTASSLRLVNRWGGGRTGIQQSVNIKDNIGEASSWQSTQDLAKRDHGHVSSGLGNFYNR